MTVAEVAEKLDISEKRVREYCRAGRLGTLWQNRWLITEGDFNEFMKTYTGKPGRPRKGKK